MSDKPDLLSLEDAKSMPREQAIELFKKHMNPGQLHFLKLLGFDRVLVDRAEGMNYYTRDGQEILDFFGGSLGIEDRAGQRHGCRALGTGICGAG